MEAEKKLDFLCVVCGTAAFLILSPMLAVLGGILGLKGSAALALNMIPVHLGLILVIAGLTKKTYPDKKLSESLNLAAGNDFSIRDTAKRFAFMFFATLAVTAAVNMMQHIFHWDLPEQPLVQLLLKTGTPDLIAVIFISAAILAPVSEELLFRGALFRLLRDIFGNEREAVIATALLFALIHWNLQQFLSLFLMGVLLQLACNQTKTLLTAVLMHAANNLLSVTIITLWHCIGKAL